MNPATREALTKQLSALSEEIAEYLRGQILNEPGVRRRAERLHADERVGDVFELWTDLLSRRAAVMWVLRSVYVRVLEDRNLLSPKRIIDRDSEDLFRHLAPDLGETAYLRWVDRDLVKPTSGLAELFSPTPAEVTAPSDALSRRLLDFWRDVDPDTGERRWRFDQEDFDSRLLGDLYQDLDPVVKSRYALLQTPDFIVEFILDETLEPAIATWGVEAVRLIDSACGSGHFLLAGFDRLFVRLRAARPELTAAEAARHVLDRIVGIDINDYACALARARLVMHALEASGSTDLADAADLHPRVFWADGLDQLEREEDGREKGETQQLGFGEEYGVAEVTIVDKPAAMLTPRESRAAVREALAGGFHAVVANPPYITERDPARKEYHREQVEGRRRYVSAYRLYSLVCPFTERCFQLATSDDGGGYVGMIVSNSFTKREFGKALIEEFMPTITLTKVVDTSGAYIPGHGTPTVLLFGRDHPPDPDKPVLAVMGKRGEPAVPEDAAEGLVWQSIVAGHETIGYEDEYISVDDVVRSVFDEHPWSLQGGGAARLRTTIEATAAVLASRIDVVGFVCMTRADDVYFAPTGALLRHRVDEAHIIVNVEGEKIRNWGVAAPNSTVFPYAADLTPATFAEAPAAHRFLWPHRTHLWLRREPNGNHRELGMTWWEWSRFQTNRYRTRLSIAFAFVATHNHFVLDRGGKVFNRSAPVIKLPPEATEEEHLMLLGQLNSSTACFWMKQVFFTKGAQGINEGLKSDDWERRYEHDSTKLLNFPVATTDDERVLALARELDAIAQARVDDSPRAVIDATASQGAGHLRSALSERHARDTERLYRMVALQEELDWLCYALYHVDEKLDFTAADVAPLAPVDTPPLVPGQRPFEILLARDDAERRAAIERGETPSQQPTEWFSRHGWEPVTDPSAISDPDYRARVEARLALIGRSKHLRLLEQPTYKRRWYRPDYDGEEQEALDLWLADRLEDWAKGRRSPWTVAQAAVGLETDPAVRAVCEVRTARRDYSLVGELQRLVGADSVPNNKHHMFKPKGLEKRRAWERTWELQHAEDRGEDVDVPVPPKYRPAEFRKNTYWKLRGKLDVPKERFIAFTEVPGAHGDRALYGWAGWTPQQRARVVLELDERAEAEGVPVADRYGLLYGAWFLLPWVAWESESAAAEFRAVIQDLVGEAGVTEDMLQQWADAAPGVAG